MSNRLEVLSLIDEAIDAHRKNIARAQIRAADLGLAAPDILSETIVKSNREIDRLILMRQNLKDGTDGPPDGERFDQISAQVSVLQGEFTTFRQDVRVDINKLANVVQELRNGCPLFNPEAKEGPLVFVKKKPAVSAET